MQKYSVQYVGEMENALRVQLTGHHSDIHHHRINKPVARHFNLSDHSIDDLTIMVIKKIHREEHHQTTANCSKRVEVGLNSWLLNSQKTNSR